MDDKVLISESTLTDIADAIRSKNSENDLYSPSEMPDKIRAISGGGGTDTSDADATSSDILEGKVAYSQGVRLVGTVNFGTVYTGSSEPDASLGVDGDIYIQTF